MKNEITFDKTASDSRTDASREIRNAEDRAWREAIRSIDLAFGIAA